VEARSVSDADLVILTPTLEDLGLLEVPVVRARWLVATQRAQDQRAANIAKRVRHQATAEVLEAAADQAVKRALEAVTRDLRVYVMVDKSASMQGGIERAKTYLTRFLQGFALDRLHVAVFNTVGKELTVPHASAAGVAQAFKGHRAGGGTCYASGLHALRRRRPLANEDALFLFVGDQDGEASFAAQVHATGFRPVAFGLLEVVGSWGRRGQTVENTAAELGIPCFGIDESMFGDVYAASRILRDLIAATPVGKATVTRRKSLVETILETPLLAKPVWA
ncbi:MAG: VWA domain-containing protein, partial [Myxococcota bacterium]